MDILYFGLISASVLLLSAVGFALIVQVEGFLNIAHGQMLLLGGYLGLYLSNVGLPIALVALGAALLSGLVGVLMYGLLFKPVKSKGILVLLFTSVGAAYVIHGLVGALAGKRLVAYDLPSVRAMQLFDEPFMTRYELAIVVVALALALAIHLFMTHTRSGQSIRAVADNEELARAGHRPHADVLSGVVRGLRPRRPSRCLPGGNGVPAPRDGMAADHPDTTA